MSDAWASYPGAPEPGSSLCDLKDIPDPGTYSVNLGEFSVLIARKGDAVWAYVNACPHQYLPLDWRKEDVLSADGSRLICSNHEASFDLETGEGVSGFAQGCELDVVPVTTTTSGSVTIANR